MTCYFAAVADEFPLSGTIKDVSIPFFFILFSPVLSALPSPSPADTDTVQVRA